VVYQGMISIRYQEYSFPSLFVPWNIRSHDGTFVLGTIRSLEHSFPGPFVPWNFRSRYPGSFHIAPAFEKLSDTQLVTGNTAIQTLLEYVKTLTWIDSRLWPTSSLSAYRSSAVRTNNVPDDVEGWHNRLNSPCHRAIWTCTSWPRFCSRRLPTSASRLHWCLRHVCAGTSRRPISACKGGWRQCGRLTRPDS